MDKQKIEISQQKLLVELSVAATLYENNRQLTISQIEADLNNAQSSYESIRVALQNLVFDGIVSVRFQEKQQLLYQISEFGKYFFEKLIQENNNIKNLSNSIGGNS